MSRTLGQQLDAKGGGAPAQRSPPRNLQSASLQIHLRYLQSIEADVLCWLLSAPTSNLYVNCTCSILLHPANLLIFFYICFLCCQSLIPDIRPPLGQDAVVDLHPEEAVLSGAEDEERDRSDQDLQIRRTVTQVSLMPSCVYMKDRVELSSQSDVL